MFHPVSLGAAATHADRKKGLAPLRNALPTAVCRALSVGIFGVITTALVFASPPDSTTPSVAVEKAGRVIVEAEDFVRQTKTEKRAFHRIAADSIPSIKGADEPTHVAGASGNAYLEVLPDTRQTHQDRLIRGENFSPEPGRMAVLDYDVHFSQPGRYYVWVRAYSTGSEDNGLHVGIDGTWPASGQRLQWCAGKHQWWWESKQRTEAEHCGEPHKIYLDVAQPGRHTIHFSMREDGFEFDQWLLTTDRNFQPPNPAINKLASTTGANVKSPTQALSPLPVILPRQADGKGEVRISGTLRQWHKVTLTLDGPFAHEQDNQPNPFLDYRMTVTWKHADGTTYQIPGYFAADGDAANSAAVAGTAWTAHFAPDRTGAWSYDVEFTKGPLVALDTSDSAESLTAEPLAPFTGKFGSIVIAASDKTGRDMRAKGRLQYVGKRYLQHAGDQSYFLKAGADAPETLLGYADFDNTIAGKPDRVPLKTWQPHVQDWQAGDPVWQDGKGKGLIGAINYLSGKGCNAFSFLTYNAGGDGDNVWPFIDRQDKLHYDCSKLDQWGIVFEHGTAKGMYLHFKMQETENDDHRTGTGKPGFVAESLDGGELGTQRKLYCRELIARFGHNLALNWNLGEENTQTTEQQIAMIDYIDALDAYDHPIVLHTYPDQQDRVYEPLLGDRSKLHGLSLQNSAIQDTHWQTVKWVQRSAAAGRPWVVAFDESGSAAHGQCPDLGYRGFDGRDRQGKRTYTEHDVRRQTLWGTLMAGGAGVEYYFGYQFVENDLNCQDWRSRDRSWDYCRIALQFFQQHAIPLDRMQPADQRVGNEKGINERYCLAAPDELYLVYLAHGGTVDLDLRTVKGDWTVEWFNPRTGGALQTGTVATIKGGRSVSIGHAPPISPANASPASASESQQAGSDWLAVIRRRSNH